MKFIFNTLLLIALTSSVCTLYAEKNIKLSRVKRNADGTITELREVDRQTILRETLHEKRNGERIISSKATYIIDLQDRARSCIIADGKGRPIFKVIYGYHRSTGQLIAESMYDVRVDRLNKKGQKIPVQRLYYKYDAQGNRSKPFAITSQNGKEVHKTTGWNKHIKERLDRVRFDKGEYDSTIITPEEVKRVRK